MNNQDKKDASAEKWYCEELDKPLGDIREDIFFRKDNFKDEDWYDDFLMFLNIGVCQPKTEHILTVQKALKIMGYNTRISKINGGSCVLSVE